MHGAHLAYFHGGPWDGEKRWLQGRPPQFHVLRTSTKDGIRRAIYRRRGDVAYHFEMISTLEEGPVIVDEFLDPD